jgi:hypothetical protein
MVCEGLSAAHEDKVPISLPPYVTVAPSTNRLAPGAPSTNRFAPGAPSTNRFAKPVEASVLSEAAKGVIPLKTEQSTRWAVNNFECWARSRAPSSADTVPLDILHYQSLD